MTSVKVRNTCLQEFSELSALISSIKCQKGLRQQFITCDDIFTEGAKSSSCFYYILRCLNRKAISRSESDKLDGFLTCWPPKHAALHLDIYILYTIVLGLIFV